MPPAFAPRTSTGPTSACPASSSSSYGSNRTPCSYSQPAFGHEKAIVSPGSTETIGGELARVVPVQRATLERELVYHERGIPIQASRGASNTRRPSRRPSSENSLSETACHSSARNVRATSAGT